MQGYITDPEEPGGLVLREVPEPTPSSSDVIVDVHAYAVNRGELTLLQLRPNGWQPGQDVAGVVASQAPDGSGPPVGTRVVGCADGGGWSQRVAVPSYRVGSIPDNVSFEQAAALPVAGLTALRGLRLGGLLLGRRVLITGASGGVGSFAIQLAVLAGAKVTSLVSGPGRVDVARRLGSHEVVTKLDERSGPFHLVFDGVGGDVLMDATQHTAPGGVIVTYGLAGGKKAELAFSDVAGRQLVGFRVYATDLQTFGEDLAFLAELIGSGHLRDFIGTTREWRDTAAAVDTLRQHATTGKVVLTVAG
jgi:NADPH:quinone reductase-like Zn-dependent oxidoreductase